MLKTTQTKKLHYFFTYWVESRDFFVIFSSYSLCVHVQKNFRFVDLNSSMGLVAKKLESCIIQLSRSYPAAFLNFLTQLGILVPWLHILFISCWLPLDQKRPKNALGRKKLDGI